MCENPPIFLLLGRPGRRRGDCFTLCLSLHIAVHIDSHAHSVCDPLPSPLGEHIPSPHWFFLIIYASTSLDIHPHSYSTFSRLSNTHALFCDLQLLPSRLPNTCTHPSPPFFPTLFFIQINVWKRCGRDMFTNTYCIPTQNRLCNTLNIITTTQSPHRRQSAPYNHHYATQQSHDKKKMNNNNSNDMLIWFLMEILMCRSQNMNPLLSLPSLLSSTVHTQIFPFIHIPHNSQHSAHTPPDHELQAAQRFYSLCPPFSHITWCSITQQHNCPSHKNANNNHAPTVLFILLCPFRVQCGHPSHLTV